MTAFILPLTDPAATDPENVGPKAANLAALTQAGLPTPGGFALTAAAYRHQLRHLGIEDLARGYNEADLPSSRKLSVQIRLALYDKPIAPEFSSRCSRPGARSAPTARSARCAPRR